MESPSCHKRFLGGFILFLFWQKEVASLTQVRPNVIRLEVPNHLEAGADLLRLNGSAQSYRYLISNDADWFAKPFFLANGQTLTTLEKVRKIQSYSSVPNCGTVGNRHTVGTFQIINKHTVQKSAYRGTKFAKKNKHTCLNSTKRAVIE